MNMNKMDLNKIGGTKIILNLNYSLTDSGEEREISKMFEKIKLLPPPDFARINPSFAGIEQLSKKYAAYKNILVVGNGGAINSFRGFYSALVNKQGKKMILLNTVEPEFLQETKAKYSPEDSLLVVVSKSGLNPTCLEILFHFWEYSKIAVCTENGGALYEIVQKEKIDFVTYPLPAELPSLEDRHTGFSASGLMPASLAGINILELCQGAKEMYQQCAPSTPFKKNPALQAAVTLYSLEQKGFTEIFCPVYSTKLFGFLPAIIQLMHETVCKNGQGQTIFGDLAPESQHHTNQRFFGGRKNCLGLFVTASSSDLEMARSEE